MSNKVMVIYHGGCIDGFGAAWIVHRILGDRAEYIPATYQSDPPDVTGRSVLMLDFSYKRPVLERLVLASKTFLMLDHHRSARLEWAEGAEREEKTLTIRTEDGNKQIHFDESMSGAMLTWQLYFKDLTAPHMIQYIQDHDLWRFWLEGTREYTQALRSYPMDFATWDALAARRPEDMIAEGRHICRFIDQKLESFAKRAYRVTLAGYDVPIVNAPWEFASELANKLAKDEPFAGVYQFHLQTGMADFSLRSEAPDGVDVSEIAARFGGGGHKHAAGFKSPIEELEGL